MATCGFWLALLLLWRSSPNLQAGETIPDTVDEVQPKVVKLFGAGGLKNLAAYGTGFLVSAEGHIVTVWSHLLHNDVVTVVLSDGRKFFGKVIGADSSKDVAVLKIDADNLPYFDLNEVRAAGPGSRVLAFSNMFKVATGDEYLSVQQGVIAASTMLKARKGRYQAPYKGEVYVVDAVTNNPGSAGGVLTTREGKLLGMIGRELINEETNTWFNYCVPISQVKISIDNIIAGTFKREDPLHADTPSGQVNLLEMGIVLVPDVVYRTPAYIDAVVSGSQAAELKLQPDDIIVFANGELVPSIRALHEMLSRVAAGDDLKLVVRRGDSLQNVTLRIPDKAN